MPQQTSFFAAKEPPALLKHGVLRRYSDTFGKKVGSTSLDHRLFIADCFAGRGEYEDGSPGSPALLAKLAFDFINRKGKGRREVESFYIEKEEPSFRHLEEVLLRTHHLHTARLGSVDDYVEEMTQRASGVPALFFVDPFGAPPSFKTITEGFMGRHGNSPGPNTPPTEVIISFMLPALYRRSGHLISESDGYRGTQKESNIEGLDRSLGGKWWHDIRRRADVGWQQQILETYVDRLTFAANCRAYTIPVSKEWEGEPLYYMILLTRRADGIWFFNEACSYALDDLYQSWIEGRFELWDRKAIALSKLESNLQTLRDRYSHFRIRDHIEELYEGVLGHARAQYVKETLNRMDGTSLTWDHSTDVFKAEVRSRPALASGGG